MIKKTRSVLMTVVLLSLSLMLLQPISAAEPVKLVFLTFETPALTATYWDNAINASLASLPKDSNITVQRIVSPGIDRSTYAKQLLASDQFPDILQSINTQDFVTGNLLTPWDSKWIEAHFVIPYGNALGGKVWQAPTNSQIIPFVFYNKDIFDKVGVKPPTTWDEFVSVATKIKAAGFKPLLTCGAGDAWCSSILPSGIISADLLGTTPDWVAQRYAGKVKFSDANMSAAFGKYKSLVDAGVIDSGDLGVDYATTNKTFEAGNVAMYAMANCYLPEASKLAQ